MHFSRQGNRPGEILDTVTVHLDAPIGEKDLEAVPVAGDIGDPRQMKQTDYAGGIRTSRGGADADSTADEGLQSKKQR